ncbi:TPA: hypothetical protein ACSB3R_003888, partial [Acinetobacter baumannii]
TNMYTLCNSGIYCYHLIGFLLKDSKIPKNELHSFIRKGLISDNEEQAKYAMYGLYLWIEMSFKDIVNNIEFPVEDLIREIGLAISTRRRNNLPQALLAATSIFKNGSQDQQNIISKYVLEGLEYLLIETDYKVKQKDPEHVPIIRLNCYKLAYTISKTIFSESIIIKQWLEEGKNDPLPEVSNISF